MTQIKTKLLETSKARVLVVGGLPEDARDFTIHDDTMFNHVVWNSYSFTKMDKHTIPYGDFKLLGKLSEIMEEQWKGIVEEHPVLGGFGYYKDTVPSFFDTAKKAGLSLIESKVLLGNPYEKPRIDNYRDNGRWIYEFADADYENEVSNYQAAEEQVFHNPVLFWEKK